MELRYIERFSAVVAFVSLLLKVIDARGRMLEPSQRSSLWRHGHNTPINRDDDGLNCGGYWHQWQVNGGKCGVCGDPYDVLPRQNEAGGKFATNIISRTYDINTKYMNTVIEVKKNMKGYFEFRLCPDVRMDKPVTQKCLDEYLLEIDGHGNRFYPQQNGIVNLKLLIPSGMQCDRCVLQWKWHTAMNWGKCADGSGSKVGCGDQEEYYNCADIAIGPLKSTQSYTPITIPNPSVLIKAKKTFGPPLSNVVETTVTTRTTTEPILPIFDFQEKGKLKKSDVEKFVANKMASDQVHMKAEEMTAVSMMNVNHVPKVEGIILPFLGDKPTGVVVGNSTDEVQDTSGRLVQNTSSTSSLTSDILNQYIASSDFMTTRARRTTRSLPDTSTASVQTLSNNVGSLMGTSYQTQSNNIESFVVTSNQTQSNNVGSLMGNNVGILTIPGNSVMIDKKTASSSGVLSGPRTVGRQNVVVSSVLGENQGKDSTYLQNVDQVGIQTNTNKVSISEATNYERDSSKTDTSKNSLKTNTLSESANNILDTVITTTLPSTSSKKVKSDPTTEFPSSVNYKTETQENGKNVQTQHTVSITVNHTITHTGTDDDVSHKPVIDVNRLRKIVDFIKRKEDKANPISVSAKNIFRSNGKSKLSVNSFSGASNTMSNSGQLVKFKISVGENPLHSKNTNTQEIKDIKTEVTTTEATPIVTDDNKPPSADMGIPISIEKSQSISQTPRRLITTTSVPQTTTGQVENSEVGTEKSSFITEGKSSSSIISNNAVIAGIGGFSAGFDQTNAQNSLSLSTGLGGTMNIAGGSLSSMHVPSDTDVRDSQKESGKSDITQTSDDGTSVHVDASISTNKKVSTKQLMTTTTGQPELGASYKVDVVKNSSASVIIKSKEQDVSHTVSQTSSSLSSQTNSLAAVSSLSAITKTSDESSDKTINTTTKTETERIQKPIEENSKINKNKSQIDFAVVGNKMASDTQMRPMDIGLMKETTVITKTIAETSNKNEKALNTQKGAATEWKSMPSDSLQITAASKQATKKESVTIPTTLPPQTVPSTFSPTSAPSAFMSEGGLADQLLSKPILIKGSINLGAPNSQWQSFPGTGQDQKMVDMGSNFADSNQMNSNTQFGNSMSSGGWITMSNSGTSGMNADLFQSLSQDTQINNRINSLSSTQTSGSNGFVPLPPGEIMNLPFGSDMSAFQQQQSSFDPGFAGFEISGNINQNNFNQGVSSGVLSTAFDQSLSQTGMDQTLLVAPDSPVYDSSYGPLLSSSGKSGLDAASAFAFVTIPPEPVTRRPTTTTSTTTEMPTTTTLPTTTTKKPVTTTLRRPTTTTLQQTTRGAITTAVPSPPPTTTEAPTTTIMPFMKTTAAETTVAATTAALTTQARTTEVTTTQPKIKTTESFTNEKNFLQSMFKALTEIMMKVKNDQGKEMAQNAMSRFDNTKSKSNAITDNAGQNIQSYSEGNTLTQNLDQRQSQSISTSEAFQQDVRRDRIINSQTSSNTNNFMNMNSASATDTRRQMTGDMSIQQNAQSFQALIPTTLRTTTTTEAKTTTTPRPVTDALISGLSGLMPRMGGGLGMSDRSNNVMSSNLNSDMSTRSDNSMSSGLNSGSSSSFTSSFSSSSSSSWNPVANSNSASSTWTQQNGQGIDLMSNIPTNSPSFSSNGISFTGGNVMTSNQDSTWNIMDTQQNLADSGMTVNQIAETRTQAPSNTPIFRNPPDTLVMNTQSEQPNYSPQIQYQEIPPTYAPPMTTVSASRNNQLDASLFGTGVAKTSGQTQSNDAAWGLGSSNSNIALTTGGTNLESVQSRSSSSIWKSLASGSNPLDFAAIIQKPTKPPITTPAPTTTTVPPTTPLPLIDVNDLTPQSVDPMSREVTLNMVKSMATTRESLLTLLYTTGGELLNSMGIDPNQLQGSVTTAVVNVVPELRRVLRLPPRRNYPKTPYIPGYAYSRNTSSSSVTSGSSGASVQPIPTPDPVQRTIETAMAKQMLTMLGLAPEPPDVPARGRGRGGRGGMPAQDANIWAAADAVGPGGGGGGRGGRGGGRGGGMRNDLAMFASAFMDPAEARELGLIGGRGRGGMGGGGMGGGMGGGGFGGRGGRRGGGRRQQAVMDAMMEVFGF